jgi:catechol 2,3-dioxygenase-like lactoylglutathione lyase family enzyme
MLTGIDHVVVLVRDLEGASGDYRRLGFRVVPGGRHATGTHNALVGLADGTYLELLPSASQARITAGGPRLCAAADSWILCGDGRP